MALVSGRSSDHLLWGPHLTVPRWTSALGDGDTAVQVCSMGWQRWGVHPRPAPSTSEAARAEAGFVQEQRFVVSSKAGLRNLKCQASLRVGKSHL